MRKIVLVSVLVAMLVALSAAPAQAKFISHLNNEPNLPGGGGGMPHLPHVKMVGGHSKDKGGSSKPPALPTYGYAVEYVRSGEPVIDLLADKADADYLAKLIRYDTPAIVLPADRSMYDAARVINGNNVWEVYHAGEGTYDYIVGETEAVWWAYQVGGGIVTPVYLTH